MAELDPSTLAVQARDTHGTSHLLGSGNPLLRSRAILSPFFQLKRFPLDTETPGRTGHMSSSRDIRISEINMAKKAIVGPIYNFSNGDGYMGNVDIKIVDTSSDLPIDETFLAVYIADAHDTAAMKAKIQDYILGYSTTNSYGITAANIEWWGGISFLPSLENAPQAAIADAPADAVTNYNVVTTLLGAVTGALNTANTKQNDIATKLNSLLAELRTLGLIST